jgi:hypothetical protein
MNYWHGLTLKNFHQLLCVLNSFNPLLSLGYCVMNILSSTTMIDF